MEETHRRARSPWLKKIKKERTRPLLLPAGENPALFPALPVGIPHVRARHVTTCARRINDDRLAIAQRLVGKDPEKPQCAEPDHELRRYPMMMAMAIRMSAIMMPSSPARKRRRCQNSDEQNQNHQGRYPLHGTLPMYYRKSIPKR